MLLPQDQLSTNGRFAHDLAMSYTALDECLRPTHTRYCGSTPSAF
jgi:hypothetical protein